MSALAFPVTWCDNTGKLWKSYAHREKDIVVCDDGTQLYPEGEGVTWLYGHYTRQDKESSCLILNYEFGDDS